jgi:hypothetical protein
MGACAGMEQVGRVGAAVDAVGEWSRCPNPECVFGGVPCDCTTNAGYPKLYCRVSGHVRMHSCPVCSAGVV